MRTIPLLQRRHTLWALAAFVVMTACGGGGGGGGDAPPPSDTAIQGNFFPLAIGDIWVYDNANGGRAIVRATGTRQAEGRSGVVVTVDDPNDGTSESIYLVTSEGVRQVPVALADPITQAIGAVDVLRYPLHAGDRFVQIDRTISSGIDFDGDGLIEPADVHSTVLVVGLENVTTQSGSYADSLHVRTSIRVDVRLTSIGQTVVVDTTVDDWYARDVGPVRTTMRNVSQGVSEEQTLALAAYRVAGRRSESTPPALQTRVPADGSVQGQIASVRASFSEALDPVTLTRALTVEDAQGHVVAGTLEAGPDSLLFWPVAPLVSGRYTVRVAPTVADLLGNPLGTERTWVFDIDAAGPQIVTVWPVVGAVDVARDVVIRVRFDEPLDPSSLGTANVSLRTMTTGDAPITVSVVGDIVTVTPSTALERGSEYTLVLGTSGYGARDLYGNVVQLPIAARFTTDYGRFSAPVALQPEAGAEAVAVGDVNSDGRQDVVLAVGYDAVDTQAFRLAVYHQQAAGGLPVAPQWIATRATYGCRPTSVAVGDVNGDGRNDVVLAEFGCGVEVFLQGADGVLRAGPFLPSAQSFLVRLTDFNADGRLDLIAVGWSDSVARVWLQSVGGALEEAGTPAVETQGWGTLAVGDLDGDGRADFVVTSGQGDRTRAVGVVLQHGDGSFAPPVYLAATSLTINQGVAIGDVDSDGRAELVVAVDDHIGLWRVQAGTLVYAGELATAGGVGPLTLADVNGDGRRDLVIAHGGGAGVGLYLQQPGGALGSESRYIGYAPWPQPDVLAVADISGDGRIDIVLAKSVLMQRAVDMFAEGVRRPGIGATSILRRALGSQ